MNTPTSVAIAPARRASSPVTGLTGAPQASCDGWSQAAAPSRKARKNAPECGGADLTQLTQLEHRVRELSRELMHARERECARLAQELHDELGAHLVAARLAAARIETWLPATSPPACAEALTALSAALDSVCDASRQLVDDRHASQLDGGLVSALSHWTTQFSARTQLPMSFVCAADVRLTQLTPDAMHAIYRVAQEALNNVAKHANASSVMLSVATGPGVLTLEVTDDGVGLAPGARAKRGRFGLSGMRARCEAFGGTLRITGRTSRAPGHGPNARTRRGTGTTLTARFAWDALTGTAAG